MRISKVLNAKKVQFLVAFNSFLQLIFINKFLLNNELQTFEVLFLPIARK